MSLASVICILISAAVAGTMVMLTSPPILVGLVYGIICGTIGGLLGAYLDARA